MADETAHVALANRTQGTINHLCEDVGSHAPWIATCAFYKALHIIEAIFANDPEIQHSTDHGNRGDILKTHVRFEQIFRDYSKLVRAANIARYLEYKVSEQPRTVSCFEDVYSPGVLTAGLLLTHLNAIERAAATRLSAGITIDSVTAIKGIVERPRQSQ